MHKILILGSGAAGLTAAIYAGRAGLKPALIHGIQRGGQLTITTEVENYPGFKDGIMGPALMEEMEAQARRFETTFIEGTVTKVDLAGPPFKVWIDDERVEETEALIIGTGASAKLLGLPSEQTYMGFGVSACATCDGFFFKNKKVYVVGGGDSACEEANFLTKYASEVKMVVRRDALRASKIMQQRAMDNPKIEILWEQNVTDVLDVEQGRVTGLELTHSKTGEKQQVAADGLFLAIGHKPNTDLFKGVLDMDDVGYLKVERGTSRTNVEGVFACGDAMDPVYRQAVTAAGTGCMAAIDAERWLAEHGID